MRDFERGDFDRLISWVSSAAHLRDWSAAYFRHPLDYAQLEEYLESASVSGARRRIFTAVDGATRKAVGHIELSHIWPHLSGRVSRVLVGSASDRGKGLGTRIVRALARSAFDEYAFDRIDLGVSDRNRAAIRCYAKVGFVHVGTWSAAFQTAAGPIHVYWMSLTQSDFLNRDQGG